MSWTDLDEIVLQNKWKSKLKHQGSIILLLRVQGIIDDKQHLNQSNNIGITITLAVIAAGCG
jgi:hypothetical protein